MTDTGVGVVVTPSNVKPVSPLGAVPRPMPAAGTAGAALPLASGKAAPPCQGYVTGRATGSPAAPAAAQDD